MAKVKKQRPSIPEEFRTLAENSPDIIDRFDRRFRHLYVNPAGLAVHQKKAGRIIGKTIRQTGVPEPYSSLWEQRIQTVFDKAEPLNVTDTFPVPDGIRYFESRCVPEFDHQGRVCSVLVISRELSERMEEQDQLSRREADLREAQRVAKIGSWVYEIGKNHVRWSDELYRIYDVDEPAGENNYEFFINCVHPSDRSRVNRANLNAIRSGRNFRIDYRIIVRNGSIKHLREIGYARKNKRGKVIALFGTAQDLTELKQAEIALKRSHRELEHRVRERTAKLRALANEVTQAELRERRRIAYILHEDLQQRLVGIRFRLDILKQGNIDDAVRKDADWMIDHLAKTIELTRRLTHRLRPPVLYEFGIRAALDWLAGDMQESTGLKTRVTGTLPEELISEEIRAFVFTAVSELLLNVVRHAGTKSAAVRLSSKRAGWLAISVSDKGRGFDPTRNNHETPFGLFSIRERTEAFGGSMEITSAPDAGCTITIALPLESSVRR